MSITVHCSKKIIRFNGETHPCRIGRKGCIPGPEGREGDEKTPLGTYHLRFGLYRNDRLPSPRSLLTFRQLRQDDGWCDAPQDPAYNSFIRLPYPASHEKLWREDCAYDVILVMDHNDSPPETDSTGAGLGSAVFIHIAQPDERQTLGCVALAPEIMVRLFRYIKPHSDIQICL